MSWILIIVLFSPNSNQGSIESIVQEFQSEEACHAARKAITWRKIIAPEVSVYTEGCYRSHIP